MPSTNSHDPDSDVGKVALYLRVSSDEQRDRESIKTQREFFDQYCDLYGLEVTEIYADDGVSGTIPLHERPEGRRLLEDARAEKFETILVYRLDRLGRSLLVIVDAHDRLQASGASLRSATEPIDTSNPSGRLIFQMLASFAEYERETIGERTRAGLHRAYRNGTYTGRIPYGYCLDDNARLEVVAEEAAIVREIISNVAEGSTLYGEAKRLNDLGVPSPGWRYGTGGRKPGRSWSVNTLSNIIHQPAYSGTHEVKINGGKDRIVRDAPAIMESGLQEKALSRLEENKRYSSGKEGRKYLLAGLVKCAACGFACVGHATSSRGKKYHYYRCINRKTEQLPKGPPHRSPFLSAPWLEDLVWADVKRFLEDPGEILERVREQLKGDDATEEITQRQEDFAKRLAAKQSEKDRYVRLYAQGHISESELETYLADLKNQTDNLRLLIESAEANLAQRREHEELAETTHVWLATLRHHITEVEKDTQEAFRTRRQLVRLLVEGIKIGEKREDGNTEISITYRFDPPDARDSEDIVVGSVPNTTGFFDTHLHRL